MSDCVWSVSPEPSATSGLGDGLGTTAASVAGVSTAGASRRIIRHQSKTLRPDSPYPDGYALDYRWTTSWGSGRATCGSNRHNIRFWRVSSVRGGARGTLSRPRVSAGIVLTDGEPWSVPKLSPTASTVNWMLRQLQSNWPSRSPVAPGAVHDFEDDERCGNPWSSHSPLSGEPLLATVDSRPAAMARADRSPRGCERP